MTPTSGAWFGTDNRIEDPGNAATFDYDTRGNQTAMNGSVLAYDGENRQTSYTWPSFSKELYSYDGEGQRVQHVHQVYSGGSYNTTGTTVYVYDAKGRLAAEYGAASSSAPCGTCYLTTDALGSTRLMTDSSGAAVARYDFLPFGQEIPASSSSGRAGVLCGSASCYDQSSAVNQKFTGKERDSETGLDYFGARYYSSPQGRFTVADWSANSQAVPYARFDDPQSLNLYSYVLNNPLRMNDPDGHCCDEFKRTLTDLTVAASGTFDTIGTGFISLALQPNVALRALVDSLATAGESYGTSAGRSQLSSQLSSDVSSTRQVLFESILLGGVAVAPGASSGATQIQSIGTIPEMTQPFVGQTVYRAWGG